MTTQQKATHTQGPWHVGVRQPTSDKFIYGPKGEEIADCDRVTNFPDENLSNAKLIAAAPCLLEALKECVKRLEAIKPDENSQAYAKACEAIAKAEGRGE